MMWTTKTVEQGMVMEGGAEIPSYGVEVAPAGTDMSNRNTLDIAEAAQYINILEDGMRQALTVLKSLEQGWLSMNNIKSMGATVEELEEILSTDAWILIQQAKERVNG